MPWPEATPVNRCRDGRSPFDAGALGGVCGCCRAEVLAHHDPVSQEPAWDAHRNRTLQTGTGADLDQGSLGSVMENLAKPMGKKGFRRSLEQLWAKRP